MSALSEKARMRDALLLTEGNLTSLIGARDSLGLTADNTVLSRAMVGWRGEVRKALGCLPSARPNIRFAAQVSA